MWSDLLLSMWCTVTKPLLSPPRTLFLSWWMLTVQNQWLKHSRQWIFYKSVRPTKYFQIYIDLKCNHHPTMSLWTWWTMKLPIRTKYNNLSFLSIFKNQKSIFYWLYLYKKSYYIWTNQLNDFTQLSTVKHLSTLYVCVCSHCNL